jgi:hypothetical protein
MSNTQFHGKQEASDSLYWSILKAALERVLWNVVEASLTEQFG